ncbi:hypothetical protein D3C85_1661950 [compost metagenome]
MVAALGQACTQIPVGCLVTSGERGGLLLQIIAGHGGLIAEAAVIGVATETGSLTVCIAAFEQIKGCGTRTAEVQRHRNAQT